MEILESCPLSGKILLSSRLSEERFEWITAVIANPLSPSFLQKPVIITFYLCGDALYSLFHPKTSQKWIQLGARPDTLVFADSDDLADLGLLDRIDKLKTIHTGDRSILFTEHLKTLVHSAGFLHLYSPYMYRHTDLFLGLMHTAVDLFVPLSVILYLDGVHLCHKNQITSEFSNVQQGLDLARKKASDSQVPLIVTACQRCSQARGYLQSTSEKIHSAPCFREEVEISGLSTLIPYFSKTGPVFSADSADISGGDKEVYLLFVTGTPYGSEHTFGAISWAVALAGKEIPAYVIFVEEGAYAWIPNPDSQMQGTVRDIHAVIEATAIPGLLEYYVWDTSLSLRGIDETKQPSNLQILCSDDLTSITEKIITKGHHVRMLIW